MKQYKNRVRHEFRVAMHGYGMNVREAILDAMKTLKDEIESGMSKKDLENIEEYELVLVDETDTFND